VKNKLKFSAMIQLFSFILTLQDVFDKTFLQVSSIWFLPELCESTLGLRVPLLGHVLL
jgi:hypothetical protein